MFLTQNKVDISVSLPRRDGSILRLCLVDERAGSKGVQDVWKGSRQESSHKDAEGKLVGVSLTQADI